MLLELGCRQGEGRSGAPAAGRNEPHESSPLLGLEEIKFEREKGVSETGKVKGEMKMKDKRGLYRGGGDYRNLLQDRETESCRQKQGEDEQCWEIS